MIDVILPVLDERDAIPLVIRAMPLGYRPIVVDNGSTDGSADLARSLGATVVNEPRRGFGSACWAGLKAARSEVVCFMDCDGSLDPSDLPRIVSPVVTGTADLAMGRRIPTAGAWPAHARLANRLLALHAQRRCKVLLRDIGPMRSARRTSLIDLGLRDRRFGWPLEMVIKAADAGWTVVEVDVPYRPRQGKSKVTGTVRGTLRTIKDMRAVLR
jgi:glycosyltransferase involved in cell wall biosynthesis